MRESAEESFRAFARDHSAALRRSAYLLCGDWHLAEDLVQNTLVKVYRAWRRVDGTFAVRFARKTLMRSWLDERRRPWRRAERRDGTVPELAHPAADPAEIGGRTLRRDFVLAALDRVPAKQRAVLVLRYWDDLPIAEVAAALGCSEGTVKSQAARGLRNLRAEMERADPNYVGAYAEGAA